MTYIITERNIDTNGQIYLTEDRAVPWTTEKEKAKPFSTLDAATSIINKHHQIRAALRADGCQWFDRCVLLIEALPQTT